MKLQQFSRSMISGLALSCGLAVVPLMAKPATPTITLNAQGEKLQAQYAAELRALQQEIIRDLPKLDASKQTALQKAGDAVLKAKADVEASQKNANQVSSAKGLVEHAKGKWIGGAEKSIAAAKAALAKASDATARAAAEKDLAHWEANKQDGLKALAERQALLDKALKEDAAHRKVLETAQAALAQAQADELNAAKELLSQMSSVLTTDKLDAKIVKCVVMLEATPAGLASFAEQSSEKAALVDQLLKNPAMMKAMLVSGGAAFGQYGKAMEIITTIQKTCPKSADGHLQRLALATALEHAKPIEQSNPETIKDGPAVVDPVKRYQHYEKAYLDGELDPAFKNFTVWEYRNVIDCDAPDEILQWGRTMLRNYRPDHIYSADYGWRYVASVKTEVPYGSQNVHLDLPSQHKYQNIIKNGGVCGRRAFFGRFVLKSFGIPTWGVTQKAHAALSHWTPKGWVVNLGAGFQASWWDKEEVSMSGTQFLLETQARAHTDKYIQVQRAQWVSQVLGEPAYNERKKVAGGLWSNVGLYLAKQLAATAATLGPLGQELGEANERVQKVASAAVAAADTKVTIAQGIITIPAVAHAKTSGKSAAMKSYAGGMQIHALGGFKADYVIDAPAAGKYVLTARVATVQDGQKFSISANGATAEESGVPYTVGMWQNTAPMAVMLQEGKNTIQLTMTPESRGVTIKDFSLTPSK